MERLTEPVRRRIRQARVARLATLSEDGPALVPVCFVILRQTLYHVLDAKPKRVAPSSLRRVRNLQRDPRAAVIVDHYEEAWDRLWFVALEGTARLVSDGREHGRALAALRRKYPQYRRMALPDPAPVIALDVRRVRAWQARPLPRRTPPRRPVEAAPGRRSGSTRSRSTDRRTGRRS
jgi:PPOX class probable F420-dependent enzyme